VPDRRPGSSYRLQLRPGFGFTEAAELAGYLARLGVTHAYLSPILQAVPGSQHGYDVVDHSRISADLGGRQAFAAMAETFQRHGLGVVADIVPNHMAIPARAFLNRQLWSVLAAGRAAPYAHWFDIDWAAQQDRLLLPILAGPPAACLGDIALDLAPGEAGRPVLRYHEHVLPVRDGTEHLPLPELLDAQHYRLAGWRMAATALNYRRFFDVASLIAIRQEDPGVFAATHALLLQLVSDGLIDGLRVDHPDGLADPRGYLERLAKAAPGAWIVTEKILIPGEELPRDWRCAGTTGYDALGMTGGLFTDPAGQRPLTERYRRFAGGPASFAEVAETAKRQAARHGLAAEVSRLARTLAACGEPALSGLAHDGLAAVLTELLTTFPVYRAYVVPGEPAPPVSAAVLDRAAGAALRRLPARLHEALATVRDLALGRRGAAPEFVIRFQQTCGPVIAKGVEDTAFYRWPALLALNEVGWDPDHFAVTQRAFHAFAVRLAREWPATMTTLSTHDTKRQEDVRARLAVLAEIPAEWAATVSRWHRRALQVAPGQPPEADTEYLLWQTLVGAWPISGDRLRDYLLKAIREAKTRTSWTGPDPAYESAVLGFAAAVLADPQLSAGVAGFVAGIAADAESNALSAKLVQLTMPGVADVYQGCELAGLSLADPDNRRPVDFGQRRRLLSELDAGARAAGFDARKLLVTSRALRLRRQHPEWFGGPYTVLNAQGPAAEHVVAFARGHAVTVATRLPRRLRRSGGWAETVLPLPGDGRWHDLLTGTQLSGAHPLLSQLVERLPVALLVPEPVSGGPGAARAERG
jgi:(1->4)-alpha-D-glucan 1-alpha-D-glucosylmutase